MADKVHCIRKTLRLMPQEAKMLSEKSKENADWAQTLIYLCEMTFTIAMTVGSVKGAQTLTSKAFGL